jgi:hypothetical protein
VELTSTNRSFGLIIKLSQSVIEEVRQNKQALFVTVMFDEESNLYASQILLLVAPFCSGGAVKFQPRVFRRQISFR